MLPRYPSLPLATVTEEAVLATPIQNRFKRISLNDSALSVMTDLEKASAIIVQDITPIDQALEPMIHSGVRSLFVLDNESRVLGSTASNRERGVK